MPFCPASPIDTPYGQFLYSYTHPRKPLCSVPFGHIARGSGQLNGSKGKCEVNHVPMEARYTCSTDTYTHSTDWEPF
ncbi:hypothetical protein AVEN_39515-1, partial [Araneus ventricosus]